MNKLIAASNVDVSIIIVNYKTTDLILNCLKSIYSVVKGVCFEVIVVDNDSNDNYKNRIKNEYPDVLCISLAENMGFGRANNEGIRSAKGRNIFFLNPDTILLNDALTILSDYLDTHKNVGACGGNLYDENHSPSLSYRRILPSIVWEINDSLSQVPEKVFYRNNGRFNTTGKPMKVAYITGADLMVKRETLIEVGLFSPSFFMYYEETDLCCRIKRRGFDIVSIPDAKIQHLEGKSFKQNKWSVNEHKISIMEKSRLNFYRRNYSVFYCWVVNFIYRFFLYSRILLATNTYKRKVFAVRLKALNHLSN